MARGGYRPGAGRPRGSTNKKPPAKVQVRAPKESSAGDQTPLEYMLAVMNDATVDVARRDRMAVAAAPFVHARAAEAAPGKREQAKAKAEGAAMGRFASPAPPKLVVDNGT